MTENPETARRLSVPHADALWDAVAIPGPTPPTFPLQHERVCRAVADILDEMRPADRAETLLGAAEVEARPDLNVTPLPAEALVADEVFVDRTAAPTAWIDGHPQLEAIAAAVWEHCEHSGSGLVIDDPRNIAVAALAAVLPAPADRAAVLHEAIDVAREEGHRLEEVAGIEAARGARCVAYLLRKLLAKTQPAVPPPADRAAVLLEAADDLDTAFGDPMVKHIGKLGASHLRRRAREIEAAQASEARPETPLEKRLRFSERRNDELRAECQRRGKAKLEQAENIQRLEKQLDEVRTRLGVEILRADQAEAELLPAWEAMYEPGNVSDYLIGYANDEAPAKAAAEAWLRSQQDEVGRLEWTPWGTVTPMPDGYDAWFELTEHHDDGIPTGPGIVVRRRVAAELSQNEEA